MDDPRLDEPRRWGVFWIHHETEELRVHHRATTLFDLADAAGRPILRRFWGTACPRDEVVYVVLFINERCLVFALSG